MVARSELRRHWRAWLALALLVTAVGGLVLATAAAGWRTAGAFPGYLRRYGFDSFAYGTQPVQGFAALPEVQSVVAITSPVTGAPQCACRGTLTAGNFGLMEVSPPDLPHFGKLVSGRLANPGDPNEVLASYTMAHDQGLRLGSTITVPLASPAEQGQSEATPGSAGPAITLRVVGFDAALDDFPAVGTPSYQLLVTPAFARTVNPRVALSYVYAVRLRHGAADVPRLEEDAQALGVQGTGGQESAASITSAIHPQAVGWWVLAVLIGLAGLVAVGQALRRQSLADAGTGRTLATLGLRPVDLRLITLVETLAVGVAGSVGAVLVAVALSPIAPLGEARVAELSPGLAADPRILVPGAVGVMLAVLLAAVPALMRAGRALRPEPVAAARPSRVLRWLVGMGAPVSVVIGVRRAVERGQGDTSVPVGNALAGTALAVAALCATGVFGASLAHLTASPRLYGQGFQLWFNGTGPGLAAVTPVEDALRRDPAVRSITLGLAGGVAINGVATDAIAGQAVEGPLLVSSITGRVPESAGEVALGVKTMQLAHTAVGATVRVTVPIPGGASRTSDFRVVGLASFPPDFGAVGLDRGAVFTIDGLVAAQCGTGPESTACVQAGQQHSGYVVLVHVAPGPAGRAAVAGYLRQYPGTALAPLTPESLVNFGEAVNFPLILGLVLALFGAATVVHVLVVSVSRRRRELALLKSLGFVRHQVVAAVCWQACTVAAVGIVVGVPLGLAAGRLLWRAFATNLGVVAVPVVPSQTTLLLCLGALVGANLLAIGPAFVSARARPALILRTE